MQALLVFFSMDQYENMIDKVESLLAYIYFCTNLICLPNDIKILGTII